MWYLVVGIAGLTIGYLYRDLKDQIMDLKSNLGKPSPGVTAGSYAPSQPFTDKDRDIGLVESKTPQQIEWENREQMSKDMAGQ